VIAIKDASGEIDRVTDHRLACDDDFCLLSGVDELSLAFNASGGAGCISVTANVAPKLCAEFQAACAAGDYEKARELNDKLYPLHKAMFADASPGPVKYALSRVVDDFPVDLRLPMTPPSDAARKAVDAALEGAGLI
jgi:4-hydroxy-tetrahydrodipicolinate synthase